ncbi:hypothetical protein CONPUDRAFT_139443 [Coniophora puteana RWD-64-598 SS2]|uniref:Uncharacterized protein n=1 Tax=Coniophora puteana (strain RWD-64-598) TaxID=741705 RepID=A0A5M3MBW2_CONPW|nr:uncharacterized protein CONPUDRAFT_139443 [Coniophora puteana RWD-64-598 SS2]EIW76718.1 hypothetical protein CONPUDRAFT_139443 [Coniophora puteana RWD-64-598 SS2]
MAISQAAAAGDDGLTGWERGERREAAEAAAIAADTSLSEPAKIDALARVRNWFAGDTSTIDRYLAGDLPLAEAVEMLAAPIDRAYSTADHGRKLWESERTARNQRQYWSPEKALEMWGAQEDFPEPAEETEGMLSTEGGLWELWYAVLHAAKRIPWYSPRDGEGQWEGEGEGEGEGQRPQKRLLELVQALKARPNPSPPERMTTALRRDWIWDSGTLWSDLVMLGPSAREAWNDSPGCGAGWTAPEQRAWANVNAFVARLTATATADFRLYAMWALRDALEEDLKPRNLHVAAPPAVRLASNVAAAAAWILVAGDFLYARHADGERYAQEADVSLAARGKQLPWHGDNEISTARWRFWCRRFGQEAQNAELPAEVRELARRSGERINALEQADTERVVDGDSN